MGVMKSGCLIVITAVIVAIVLDLRDNYSPKLPVAIDGYVAPGWEMVAKLFEENLVNGIERGGAFSVFYQGELVLDLVGGYVDVETQQPWDRDTLGCYWSSTKGVGAIIIAMLVDRGLLDYNKPVAKYWPEFAVGGKEKITVKQLISHQAGVVSSNTSFSIKLLTVDPQELSNILANIQPWWEPGTAHGYHPYSMGLYMDQLVRRVDPQHRDIGQFFEEEIAEPFGIDFSIGLPKEENYRVARIYPPPYGGAIEVLFIPGLWKFVLKLFTDSKLKHVWNEITDFKQGAHALNNPYIRELPIASTNGFGTVQSLAKLYGILANGGMHEGKKLLPKSLIEELNKPLVTGYDGVVTGRNTSFSVGAWILNNPKGKPIFGHPGYGGNMAYADPSEKLGWSYLNNFPSIHMTSDPRYLSLQEAMYDVLKRKEEKKKKQK